MLNTYTSGALARIASSFQENTVLSWHWTWPWMIIRKAKAQPLGYGSKAARKTISSCRNTLPKAGHPCAWNAFFFHLGRKNGNNHVQLSIVAETIKFIHTGTKGTEANAASETDGNTDNEVQTPMPPEGLPQNNDEDLPF